MPLLARWLDGVHAGAVGRRRGKKGTGYSPTTLEGYELSLQYVLTPEFGVRPAGEIDDREWQTWVDRLSREGLSRSRIANHLAMGSAHRGVLDWCAAQGQRLAGPRREICGPHRDNPAELCTRVYHLLS